MQDGVRRAILEVEDLSTVFETRDGTVFAVNGVSFALAPGEMLGVVGESGSGKSVTMMSMLNLLPSPPARTVSQHIHFEGAEISHLSAESMRRLRGRDIGFIFQDPMTSLNPVLTIGFQLMEPLREHLGLSKTQARSRAAELLSLVGIPNGAARLRDYPHQFSGGMRQRVMIAIALACEPKLLIADEPTTALDVTIQAQILELMRDLRQKMGMAIIWITHDLGVIAGVADHVAVMYGGQIVEYAAVAELFANPQHPYTRALLQTLPRMDGDRAKRLASISGTPPNLYHQPTSCAFAPRCAHMHATCQAENPTLRPVVGVDATNPHSVACFWQPSAAPPPRQQAQAQGAT